MNERQITIDDNLWPDYIKELKERGVNLVADEIFNPDDDLEDNWVMSYNIYKVNKYYI